MFNRIISYDGFWKSVVLLSIAYMVILVLLQWGFAGFEMVYWKGLLQSRAIWGLPLAGFIAGFMVSYGKFWARLKRQDQQR